jgi:hypothetical protein
VGTIDDHPRAVGSPPLGRRADDWPETFLRVRGQLAAATVLVDESRCLVERARELVLRGQLLVRRARANAL